MKLVIVFRRSLQAKLLGTVAAAFLAVVFFVAVYFPSQQNSMSSTEAVKQAKTLSEMLAFSVGAGLGEGNFELVQTAFQWAKKDSNVVCVLILDDTNSPITEYNPRKIAIEAKSILSSREVKLENNLITTSAPSQYKGKNLGNIILVYSIETVKAEVYSKLLWSLVILIGLATAGLSVIYRVTRLIIAKIKTVLAQMNKFAGGELDARLEVDREDEIGQLCEGFNTAINNVGNIMRDVAESTAAVASASSQISSSTEEMAAGAQEQTSQTSEVASAVEEMAKTIIENSRNASATADTTRDARRAAEQGGKVVEETIIGMKRIADVVKQSAGTVQELGISSNQIGEIVSVIDDIADQTNLLALNAAIEAARAGDQGRGFAVVADEVRKLAERTTKATKEIATMIKKIQMETENAVAAMEEGTKEVDAGIHLADKAGSSLNEIVGISQKVTDMVSQIATASEQQSSASEQISKNVESISKVTGETASGTQQIAKAAEDLNRLTENLQQLVGKFKFRDEGDNHANGIATDGKRRQSRFGSLEVRSNGKLVRS
jgi:methyl-accepting chemotaxis protein